MPHQGGKASTGTKGHQEAYTELRPGVLRTIEKCHPAGMISLRAPQERKIKFSLEAIASSRSLSDPLSSLTLLPDDVDLRGVCTLDSPQLDRDAAASRQLGCGLARRV